MELTSAGSIQNIFIFANQQSYQLEALANEALKNGIDRYVNKDYKGAIKEFKRAVGLAQEGNRRLAFRVGCEVLSMAGLTMQRESEDVLIELPHLCQVAHAEPLR